MEELTKTKKRLGCIGITLVIWAIARFVPAALCEMISGNQIIRIISFLVMLAPAWALACYLSKGQFNSCIRINLYVLAGLEGLGLAYNICFIAMNLALSTGRYNTDIYGIPYSDYPIIYGSAILFGIAYLSLCFMLAKKTTSEDLKANEETPDYNTDDIVKIPNGAIYPKAKHVKQRFCKYCGGLIDPKSKQCHKCGKQYIRPLRVVGTITITLLLLITACSLTYNSYLRNQYQEDILSLQKQLDELESRNTALVSEVFDISRELDEKTVKSDYYDHICENLSSGNIGYASSNFCTNKSIIFVSKREHNKKIKLTANWPEGGEVSVDYSSDAAELFFDDDSWTTSTQLTVKPIKTGVVVVTFSNTEDNNKFKILIVVTE